MVEHLADGLADPMQLAAAAGAGLVLDIELHLLARQMGRHARPVNKEPAAGRLGCCQRQGDFDPTDIGAEILKPELELAVCSRATCALPIMYNAVGSQCSWIYWKSTR